MRVVAELLTTIFIREGCGQLNEKCFLMGMLFIETTFNECRDIFNDALIESYSVFNKNLSRRCSSFNADSSRWKLPQLLAKNYNTLKRILIPRYTRVFCNFSTRYFATVIFNTTGISIFLNIFFIIQAIFKFYYDQFQEKYFLLVDLRSLIDHLCLPKNFSKIIHIPPSRSINF